MVPVALFAVGSEEAEGQEAEQKGLEFMKILAVDFAKDEILPDDLHKEKYVRLHALGFGY